MLDRKVSLTRILDTGLVAVLRRAELEALRPVIDALLDGGIDCLELPISFQGGLATFTQVREAYGDRLCLGAGGVFNADLATLATRLDVDFISAPSTDPGIVEVCRQRSIVSFPGAMTPTEIIGAWHHGADLIKVFPAEMVGPRFFEGMLGQLPDLKLIATGGVNEQNLHSFLEAGALAAVVGRGLLGSPREGMADPPLIAERARRLRAIVQGCR